MLLLFLNHIYNIWGEFSFRTVQIFNRYAVKSYISVLLLYEESELDTANHRDNYLANSPITWTSTNCWFLQYHSHATTASIYIQLDKMYKSGSLADHTRVLHAALLYTTFFFLIGPHPHAKLIYLVLLVLILINGCRTRHKDMTTTKIILTTEGKTVWMYVGGSFLFSCLKSRIWYLKSYINI